MLSADIIMLSADNSLLSADNSLLAADNTFFYPGKMSFEHFTVLKNRNAGMPEYQEKI
jgi:hypothetical protein